MFLYSSSLFTLILFYVLSPLTLFSLFIHHQKLKIHHSNFQSPLCVRYIQEAWYKQANKRTSFKLSCDEFLTPHSSIFPAHVAFLYIFLRFFTCTVHSAFSFAFYEVYRVHLLTHISVNACGGTPHSAIGELLEAVFSLGSVPKTQQSKCFLRGPIRGYIPPLTEEEAHCLIV
jgi:hypothetical protein